LAFAYFLWRLAGLKAELRFHRDMWDALSRKGKARLGRPGTFLRHLSQSLGILWQGEVKGSGMLCKILPKPWLELHRSYRMTAMAYQKSLGDPKSLDGIVVYLEELPEEMSFWHEELVSSLSHQLKVELRP